MRISMYKNIFRTVPVNINVPGYIQDCTCGYLCTRMYLELYLWISIYQDKSRIAPWDINVLGCIQDSTCGYICARIYLGLYLWISMYQDALQLLKPSCTGSCSYRRKLKECTKSRPGIEHRKLNKNPNLQWRHLLNIPNIQSVQTNASMLN